MFVGSKESTFTFRIQEEREIMGFSEDKTYRRFVLEFYEGSKFDPHWDVEELSANSVLGSLFRI